MKESRTNRVAALLERMGRMLATDSHANDLQPVQWEAIRYLAKANRFSKTAAAVTLYLGLTKGTVSQTLKALELKGLVKKQVDSRDRRSNQLSLTAKARRLLENDPVANTVKAVECLPAATQRSLAEGLELLLTTQLAAQNRQPFGQCRDCVYFARRHAEGTPHYCKLLTEPLVESDAAAICVEQTLST